MIEEKKSIGEWADDATGREHRANRCTKYMEKGKNFESYWADEGIVARRIAM